MTFGKLLAILQSEIILESYKRITVRTYALTIYNLKIHPFAYKNNTII